MLRWPMAAKEPSSIEAIAMNETICCQSAVIGAKASMTTRISSAMRGELWRGGEEGGHRRRRALIDVGRPHVERHRRDLEGEAGQHEDEADDEAGGAALGQRRGDRLEARVTGEAVDQRRAVEEHAGRERAEHEIFEAGLGGAGVVAVDGGDDVGGERHQLQPEIEADQVVRRDHHQHAERGEQDEDREFEALEALDPGEALGEDDGDGRADERGDLHEARKTVDDEGAAERGAGDFLHG